MKKTYGKPDIMFDSFQMCTSIAKACEVRIGPLEGTCGMPWRGPLKLFAEGPSIDAGACQIDADIDPVTEDFNGICYHVPVDSNNLFTS